MWEHFHIQNLWSYSLKDESDESDGLHSHVVLFIQCHRYYAVLKD